MGVGQMDSSSSIDREVDAGRQGSDSLNESIREMVLLFDEGNLNDAEQRATDILAISPAVPEAWNLIGSIASQNDSLEEAETAFRCVVTLAPDSVTGHENLGRVLLASGRVDDALDSFARAFNLSPSSLSIGELLLDLLNRKGLHEKVLELGEPLLRDNPHSHSLMLSFARAFRGLEDINAACRFYLAAMALDPQRSETSTELSIYFFENGRIKDALTFYASALERDQYDTNAYHGLGTCYQFMGDFDTALECYEQVLQLQPDMPGTLRNLSYVYHVLQRPVESVQAIAKVVELEPSDIRAKVQLAYYRKHICDWSDPIDSNLFEDFEALSGASPFQVLPMTDHPILQRELSKNFQANHFDVRSEREFASRENLKIRVGFFGSDFHDHATLVLMSGLFREYDRTSFEFFVYSYGVKQTGAYREALESQVDVFRNLLGATDRELYSIALSDQLDVAIDLKGFTSGGRLKPFEWGLAPIQISYLGYPGTLGRSCFDYMIADDVTIPPSLQDGYSESIMVMPHSYQPNDNQRRLVFNEDKRADHGLPEQGFVFCCFNNNYKISAVEFDIWMRLLLAVEGSVLWLLDANTEAKENLRAEAKKRGVLPERLVFAPRASIEEHLSRHQHADLFLDTFNVNAHTTASDSLWAGLPVLTLQGKQFAARVASSLLHAAGMPELIAKTEQEYEEIALRIASEPKTLEQLQVRLRDSKEEKPLFDTRSYGRSFEALIKRSVVMKKSSDSVGRLTI